MVTSSEKGVPLAAILAPGDINDISLAQETIEKLNIPRGIVYGSTLLADKGYDSKNFRLLTIERGLIPPIPKRSCTKPQENDWQYYLYNKAEGGKRAVIEQTTGHLKSFRRIRHRFDLKHFSN
jgi:transposase